jgi:flagellar biogenesis protein FliO
MDGIWTQFAGVLLVFGLLGAGLWYTRRRGMANWTFGSPVSTGQKATVIQRLPLTPNHSVHILSVSGRQFLLSCSPSSCQLITELRPDSEQVEPFLGNHTR